MIVVRDNTTGLYHTAEETQSGVLTTCSQLMSAESVLIVLWSDLELAGESGCDRCKNPTQQSLVSPFKARRTGKTSRPQWRTSRNITKEALENARLALKEIVSAIEWLERGEEGQFAQNGIDRMNLAYRFLQESLVAFKIVERPVLPEEDD